jgi:DNA-binding GntR family transcriptional regulator
MPGPTLPRVSQDSRRQRVADALREAIINGELRPGDRLVELDLSAQLGTSRGPIREALRQLEQEGLVVSYAYRGTLVADISQEEIEQVLVPIRIVIERFAFKIAMSLLDESDFSALRKLVAEMREAADAGDADRMADADLRFHELVIERSGQTHCMQLWRTIQPRVRAYFRRDASGHADRHAVAEQHSALIDALTAGDPARLATAVDEHIHIHLDEASTKADGDT